MISTHHDWALVLAAGNGTRLARLTTDAAGRAVPKQFCSLDGGPSLLEQAIRRAARVVPLQRVVVVVAEEHAAFWPEHCTLVPRRNVVVQPDGRGTAPGILLPLSAILDRDPEARVLVVPSDHHVTDEETLSLSMRAALAEAGRNPECITLLGIVPEDADPQYGWIVPGEEESRRVSRVRAFVEKPDASAAVELLRAGGVWNSFIFAADGQGLVDLYAQYLPEILMVVRTALFVETHGHETGALARAYQILADADFSRDLVQRCPHALRLLTVPACGWSDLGTPSRVEQVLRHRSPRPRPRPQMAGSIVDLSRALARVL